MHREARRERLNRGIQARQARLHCGGRGVRLSPRSSLVTGVVDGLIAFRPLAGTVQSEPS